MDCRSFDRWLDDGRPENPAALAHAETCAECAAAWAEARELEAVLSQRFTAAPPDFTDRVLASLPAREDDPVRVAEDPESPWPWWLRMLLEPSAILGLTLGVVYAIAAPQLLGDGGTGTELVRQSVRWLDLVPAWAVVPGPLGWILLIALAAVATAGLYRGAFALLGRT